MHTSCSYNNPLYETSGGDVTDYEEESISSLILSLKKQGTKCLPHRIIQTALCNKVSKGVKRAMEKLGQSLAYTPICDDQDQPIYWFMAHMHSNSVLWAIIATSLKPRDIGMLNTHSISDYMESINDNTLMNDFNDRHKKCQKAIWNSSGVLLVTRHQSFFKNLKGKGKGIEFSPKYVDEKFTPNILLLATYSYNIPSTILSVLNKLYNVDSQNMLHITFVVGRKYGHTLLDETHGLLNSISVDKEIKVFLIDFWTHNDDKLINIFIKKYNFKILTSIQNMTWLIRTTNIFESYNLDNQISRLDHETHLVPELKKRSMKRGYAKISTKEPTKESTIEHNSRSFNSIPENTSESETTLHSISNDTLCINDHIKDILTTLSKLQKKVFDMEKLDEQQKERFNDFFSLTPPKKSKSVSLLNNLESNNIPMLPQIMYDDDACFTTPVKSPITSAKTGDKVETKEQPITSDNNTTLAPVKILNGYACSGEPSPVTTPVKSPITSAKTGDKVETKEPLPITSNYILFHEKTKIDKLLNESDDDDSFLFEPSLINTTTAPFTTPVKPNIHVNTGDKFVVKKNTDTPNKITTVEEFEVDTPTKLRKSKKWLHFTSGSEDTEVDKDELSIDSNTSFPDYF